VSDSDIADPGASGADDTRRRSAKSDSAFRTISEVAEELDVPQHVLRFWETKFTQVRPLKRGGGRRYYRPEDVTLLKRIRSLLYADGLTIKGVQKLLREAGVKAVTAEGSTASPALVSSESGGGPLGLPREDAMKLMAELTSLRDDLRGVLQGA
jgi:DNA-binding transcriptional MerR regulator